MKRKTLSILLACLLLLNLGAFNVFAAEDEFVPDIIGIMSGETSVVEMDQDGPIGDDDERFVYPTIYSMTGVYGVRVTNGTIDVYPNGSDKVSVVFKPDAGYVLIGQPNVRIMHVADYITSSPEIVSYLRRYTIEYTRIDEAGNVRFDLSLTGVSHLSNEIVDEFGPELSRNEYLKLQNMVIRDAIAGIEGGDILAGIEIDVVFGEGEPEPPKPPTLYTVRVESEPAGIATFTGYGTGFSDGDVYSVAIDSSDSGYQFEGWTGSPTGTIAGSDVALVANFTKIPEPDTYSVTAVSNPAGVATFSGTGSDFLDGDTYLVDITTSEAEYTFVSWSEEPSGHIDGADVALVANYEKVIIEEPVPEEKPEEVKEEVEEVILDEEVIPESTPETLPETGGLPILIFIGAGASITGLGVKLRKKR